MADHIKASSANLDQLASKLNQIQGKLTGASAALSAIHFNAENGGNLYIGRVTGGLSGVAGMSAVQGGTVSTAARQTSRAITGYGRFGGSLSRAVRQVEDALNDNEKALKLSFLGAAGVVPLFPFVKPLIGPGFPFNVLNPVIIQLRQLWDLGIGIHQWVPGMNPGLFPQNWMHWVRPVPIGILGPGIFFGTMENTFRTGSTVFSTISDLFGGEYSYEGPNSAMKVEGEGKGKIKFKDKFEDFNDAHSKELYHAKEYDGDSVHSAERGNFGMSVGVGFEESINAAEAKGDFDNGWANGKGKVAVSELEAHGSLNAGLYSYVVDDIGNKRKVLSPGASAEIGASYTVISAEGEANLEGGPFHVGVGGDVAIGKVSAEAKGEIGMVDGKFALNVSASAEANLIEANANVHGGIDGVADVKGEVGVTIGVGAHADVGYHDGVIKADIGASVGLGFSANVSIDINPLINTVSDFGEGLCDFGESVMDLGGKAWDAFTSWW